jgi:hypothetical protein
MSHCPWICQPSGESRSIVECSREDGRDGVHTSASTGFTWTDTSVLARRRCAHEMLGIPCCDEERRERSAPPIEAEDLAPPPPKPVPVESSGADPVPPFNGTKKNKKK